MKLVKWCTFWTNCEEHKHNFKKKKKYIRENISRNVKFGF